MREDGDRGTNMQDAKGAWDLGKDESGSIWLLYTVMECMELETTVQILLVAHTHVDTCMDTRGHTQPCSAGAQCLCDTGTTASSLQKAADASINSMWLL